MHTIWVFITDCGDSAVTLPLALLVLIFLFVAGQRCLGYAGVLGENKILDMLLDDLAAHRALIIDLIKQCRPMSEVSQAVDRLILKQGHEPRHKAYPFETLAHTVQPMALRNSKKPNTLFQFGFQAVEALGRLALTARRQGW